MLPRPAHLIALIAWAVFAPLAGQENPTALPGRYGRVAVAPTKTSIYIGNVSMTMPPFIRAGGSYTTSYSAKVFPFFFYNESGELRIDISDEMLRAIDRGETVAFKGRGVSTAGEERPIEGKVTPTSATGGKIKVRVFVSKRIELIFNTTYRLADDTPKAVESAPTAMRP